MDNYHYLIASLPNLILSGDNKTFSYNKIRNFIVENCSKEDSNLIKWLECGTKEEYLTSHFYNGAINSKNRFFRLYFSLDLQIRNLKVDFVSKQLKKDGEKYKLQVSTSNDFCLSQEQYDKLNDIFQNQNILEKEQQLDEFKWDYIQEEIDEYGCFNIDAILTFLAKAQLIERWNKLDKASGEAMFKRLVDEVRGTFKGIDNKTI